MLLISLFLSMLQATACAYVLFIAVLVLNAMGPYTRHTMRISYVLLAAGALAGVYSAITAPNFGNGLMALGVALFIACNERRSNAHRAA